MEAILNTKHTPGPWQIIDCIRVTGDGQYTGYISIVGPNGERICDLFPFAAKGGVGRMQAIENAALIARASIANGG